jgi:hypothetical protein
LLYFVILCFISQNITNQGVFVKLKSTERGLQSANSP